MLDRFPFLNRPSRAPLRPGAHPSLNYRPPFFLTFIKLLFISTVIGVIGVAAYSLFWFVAASQLKSQIVVWIDARRAEGMTVEFADYEIKGYPDSLRLVLEKPALAVPGAARPWAWRADLAVATVRPWWWGRVKVSMPGQHWATVTLNGRTQTFAGAARRLDADLGISDGRIKAIAVDLAGIDFKDSKTGDTLLIDQARVSLKDLKDSPPDYNASAIDLQIAAQELRVPPSLIRPYRLPLGNRIARLEVEAGIMGEIPAGPWPSALAPWRDKGGTVEFKQLDVTYGELAMFSNGTLSLDGALQPIAAFTARVQGFIETVDTLRKQGIIHGRDAIAAKLILGALAKKSEPDGTLTVSLPLTLQERQLFAGPVLLGRVPEVRWSGDPTQPSPTP